MGNDFKQPFVREDGTLNRGYEPVKPKPKPKPKLNPASVTEEYGDIHVPGYKTGVGYPTCPTCLRDDKIRNVTHMLPDGMELTDGRQMWDCQRCNTTWPK